MSLAGNNLCTDKLQRQRTQSALVAARRDRLGSDHLHKQNHILALFDGPPARVRAGLWKGSCWARERLQCAGERYAGDFQEKNRKTEHT